MASAQVRKITQTEYNPDDNKIYQLSAGHIQAGGYLANMGKEVRSGLVTATIIAAIVGTIGCTWAYADADNSEIIRT